MQKDNFFATWINANVVDASTSILKPKRVLCILVEDKATEVTKTEPMHALVLTCI